MKKTVLFITLIIALLFSVSSCKREEAPKQFPVQPIPQEVKDYMWFETGSFWVYEDSATQELDTIRVHGTIRKYNRQYNQQTPLTDFELLTVYAKSLKTGNSYEYGAGGSVGSPTTTIGIDFTTPDNPQNIKSSYILIYPSVLFKTYYRYPTDITLIDTLPIYTLQGTTYQNVLVYHQEVDGMMGSRPTYTWVAPNYGILKKQCINCEETFWLKTSSLIKKQD